MPQYTGYLLQLGNLIPSVKEDSVTDLGEPQSLSLVDVEPELTGFELAAILLPQHPQSWSCRLVPPLPVSPCNLSPLPLETLIGEGWGRDFGQ